jgi:hypothetical protein
LAVLDVGEINRMQLALFGMQNRVFGPYLAVIHRCPVPVV